MHSIHNLDAGERKYQITYKKQKRTKPYKQVDKVNSQKLCVEEQKKIIFTENRK